MATPNLQYTILSNNACFRQEKACNLIEGDVCAILVPGEIS